MSREGKRCRALWKGMRPKGVSAPLVHTPYNTKREKRTSREKAKTIIPNLGLGLNISCRDKKEWIGSALIREGNQVEPRHEGKGHGKKIEGTAFLIVTPETE